MSKPVNTVSASELGKDVTSRARALNQALALPGRMAKQSRIKAMRAEYEATLPQPKMAWLDELTNPKK